MPESDYVLGHEKLGFSFHAQESLRDLSRVHDVYLVDRLIRLDKDLVSLQAYCLNFINQCSQDIEPFGDTLVHFFEHFVDNGQNQILLEWLPCTRRLLNAVKGILGQFIGNGFLSGRHLNL